MTMRLWSAAAVGVPGRAIVGRMAAAALLAAMLTACSGGSSYRYVANRENGNFFKVPSSWKLEDITAADAADRPTETASNVRSVWHTVFSGGVPVPGGGEPAEVVGSAQIFLVSASYREQLSLSSIRTQIFGGVDPLFAPDELVGSSVRVVSYTALQGGTGVSGSRVVANLNLAEDDAPQWVTRDVSLLFDPRKGRVFVLAMACESECYLQNRTEIDRVAASWTVRS